MRKLILSLLFLFTFYLGYSQQYLSANIIQSKQNLGVPTDSVTAPRFLGEIRTMPSKEEMYICISLSGPKKWLTVDIQTDTLYIYKSGAQVLYKYNIDGSPVTAFLDESVYAADGNITAATRNVNVNNGSTLNIKPDETINDSTARLAVTFNNTMLGSALHNLTISDSLSTINGRLAFGGTISYAADADLNLSTEASANLYMPYLSLANQSITANRTLTLPRGRKNGELWFIKNNNGSAFNWQFAGGVPITEVDGTNITSMPNESMLLFIWSGNAWVKLTQGTGGGATDLNSLTDATITTPAQGQKLVYSGSQWVNETHSGTFANRPGSPYVGQTYYQTDLLEGRYTWDGKRWNLNIDEQVIGFSNYFGGAITSLGWGFQSGTSGTGSNLFSNSTFFSVYEFTTGTTSTGLSQSRTQGNMGALATNARLIYYHRIRIPTLSDGTETYTIRVGKDGADGIGFYFRYTHSENSGQWTCVTHNGTSETATASGTTVAANTWYDLIAVYDTQIPSVKFYINGNLVVTNTTNLPANFVGGWPGSVSIIKSAGTTARTMLLDESIVKIVE